MNAADVPRLDIVDGTESAFMQETPASKSLGMMKMLLAKQGRFLTPAQWEFVAPRVAVEPTALYVHLALRVVGKLLLTQQSIFMPCLIFP